MPSPLPRTPPCFPSPVRGTPYTKPGHSRAWVSILVLFTACLAASLIIPRPASAASGGRYLYTPQSGMVHVWALKAWSDNTVLCELYRTDELQPTPDDIRAYCGEKVYTQWLTAAPCSTFVESGDVSTCTGSFFTYLGYYYRDYSTYSNLPESSASFSIQNCQPGQWCGEKPLFIFGGVEPLVDFEIIGVHVRVGGKSFDCNNASTCEVLIPLTTNQGIWVEYWAVSSFGDESEHLSLHVRNLYRGQNGGEYLVDILTSDGSNTYTQDFASLTWDVFPEVAHPNESLYAIPNNENALTTNHHLYYLAGKLIFTGRVDASMCVQSGLLDNRNANTCGEEITYQAGLDSQNAYDRQLVEAGTQYGIPPRLVKAIITQETQFWPQAGIEFEYGLGCLSENGADVLMTWDTDGFQSVCTSNYSADKCAIGYTNMTQEQRAVVRGLALRPVGTDREIDLITRVVHANVIQVDQMMRNLTDEPLSLITTYEDLWDFTIANYHAGNRCVADGVQMLLDEEMPVTFENYCTLVTDCPTACVYVDRVKGYAGSD